MRTTMRLAASLAALAALFAACTQEKEMPAQGPSESVIRVSIPETLTKVSLSDETATGGGMALAWQAGDALRVVSGSQSELYTIQEGFSGHEAEFSGTAVTGSKFSILYPGTFASVVDLKARDYTSQTQTGNGSTAHLRYNALLEDVDTYENVVFSSEWAAAHGGNLSQNGVLKLVVTLPEGVTTVTRVELIAPSALFFTDNAGSQTASVLSVALEGVDVSAAAQVLTAYLDICVQDVVIPAGTTLTVRVTAADAKEYTKSFTTQAEARILGGKLNTIRLTAEGSGEITLTDYYVSVAGAGEKTGADASNAIDLAQFKALVATVSDRETSDANAAKMDGVTFHFADGTYVLPDAETPGGLKLEYSKYGKLVEITFEGSEKAIFSGDGQYRIMTIGNQVHLTVKGCTFKDGYGKEMKENGVEDDNAGAIFIAAGQTGYATVDLEGTVFDANRTNINTKSGAALACAKGTAHLVNCTFTETNYGRNGGSIYTTNDNSVVHCTGCTFKSHAYNTGGAANNSGGTQTYTDCDFTGCYTETGWGGAIHANAADAVVTVDRCRFTACRGMTAELAKTTTSKATGIISVQTADVTINASRFEGCEGISGAVIFLQDNDGILKCTDTVFKDNIGRSRGIIQTNGKGIAFFDGCTFTGNRMTTNAWGLILHGGNPSACGFNNCTFYGNTRDQSGGNGVGLNNDGSILLTNSTYIGNDDLVAVRNTNATNAMVLLENDILVNTGTGPVTADDKMTCPHSFSHLLTGTSESVLGGGSFSEAQGVYLWNGPDASFGKTDATAFETAVKAVTVDNGNAVLGGTTVGAAFYDWLVSIGTIGKDAIGNGRGTAWWPGAYQK